MRIAPFPLALFLALVNCGERRHPASYMQLRPAERTSFQTFSPWQESIDLQSDVAIVYYGGDYESSFQRAKTWADKGYTLHIMAAGGRGAQADYVSGNWSTVDGVPDGADHADDIQMDAAGSKLSHGSASTLYYMVPTLRHTEFMKTAVKGAIDLGAKALHLEEPEFWASAGYSNAFKQEWQSYYGEPWQDPASSPQAWFKAAKLKKHLYLRSYQLLFQYAKQYAARGIDFRCYVPTHSLVNYTNWNIVSPETDFVPLPECDGFIAQVWTGTARSPQIFKGVKKERTFENAFLEYSSVKNMVAGSGKTLWFLADPVEDDPRYDWSDFRTNYEKTLIASQLHPEVTGFEVMPWPDRVFDRAYPRHKVAITPDEFLQVTDRLRRDNPAMRQIIPQDTVDFWRRQARANPQSFKTSTHYFELGGELFRFLNYKVDHLPDSLRTLIPADYAAELLTINNLLTSLADIPQDQITWDCGTRQIGVLFSDAMMLQRGGPWGSKIESFHQLALPALKAGMPVEVVVMDRMSDLNYLDAYRILLLSYEAQKPLRPEFHTALVQWVKKGGVLVFMGDGSDAFAAVDEWWHKTHASPQEHLFKLAEMRKSPAAGIHPCGTGAIIYDPASPAELSLSKDGDCVIRSHILAAVRQIADPQYPYREQNYIRLQRGPLVIAAVMNESVSDETFNLQGPCIDILDGNLPLIRKKRLEPNQHALLYDLSHLSTGQTKVLLSSSRIREEGQDDSRFHFTSQGPVRTRCVTLIRCEHRPKTVALMTDDSAPVAFEQEWNEEFKLLRLRYSNLSRRITGMVEF